MLIVGRSKEIVGNSSICLVEILLQRSILGNVSLGSICKQLARVVCKELRVDHIRDESSSSLRGSHRGCRHSKVWRCRARVTGHMRVVSWRNEAFAVPM